VLITFHANGSSARQAREDWQLLFEEGWLLLLLQSPNSLWKGAYNWEDEAGALEAAAGEYSRLTSSHSVDPSRIIAAGHSMGGKLAIELALSGKVPACGFIAVGPYISEDDIAALEGMAGKAQKLKGVILFGEADETIPQESIYSLAGRLEAHGHEVLVQHFAGIGHEFGAPIRHALSRAAGFILS
jgi:predicted esterase